jgi:hypothetical protein
MDRFFGRQPVPGAPVPGDRVMPLHFFENSLLVQGNNMAVSLVIDHVLDPEILRQSLEGLVKREGWQRLGGRLRKNVRIHSARVASIPPFPVEYLMPVIVMRGSILTRGKAGNREC